MSVVTGKAMEKCVGHGAIVKSVHLVERQVTQLAYVTNRIRVYVKVAGDIDANSMLEYRKSDDSEKVELPQAKKSGSMPRERSSKAHQPYPGQDKRLLARTNLSSYYPRINDKAWELSAIDIDWLSTGCYILGCGGGGSPHLSAIAAKQLLRGKSLTIVNAQDLPSTGVLLPLCLMGSPMVTVERSGGTLCVDAVMNNLSKHRPNILPTFENDVTFEMIQEIRSRMC